MELERISDGTRFRWSRQFWILTLQYALRYGWVPSGSSYFKDRLITAEDARAIAEALQKGLPDIPSEKCLAGKIGTARQVAARYPGELGAKEFSERNPDALLCTIPDILALNQP